MTKCAKCRQPIEQPATGRRRIYCGNRCRQAAWRVKTKKRQRASRQVWHTPADLAEHVTATHPITLDAAALAHNRITRTYLGPDHPRPEMRDALAWPHWADLARGGTVWLNPPYDLPYLLPFLDRAAATAEQGTPVLCLLPHAVGAKWWHDKVATNQRAHVENLGRLRFDGPYSNGRPSPFPCALVTYRPRPTGLTGLLTRSSRAAAAALDAWNR